MGVTGLWSLIEPVGEPVPLESLENKVLAVDVSIWLNQAVKGFRDSSGNALPNAHVLGLFHRICKLLFYKIKPIFVFDGKPPQLKKETLQRRRSRKSKASDASQASRIKLIENFLKSKVVQNQLETQRKVIERGTDALASLLHKKTQASSEKDLFELPPLEKKDDDSNSSDSENEDVLAMLNIDHSTDIHNIDLQGSRFKNLSAQKQVELLMELRERRKQNSWAKMSEMPKEAQQFSGFQLERLKKRNAMQKCLDDVGARTSEDAQMMLNSKLFVGDKAGVKKEKSMLKEIIGKDFVYLKSGASSSSFSSQGTSKDMSDSDMALALSLQEEEFATGKATKTLSGDEESSDDEIVVVEPTDVCRRSSRQGGLDNNELPLPIAIKREPVERKISSSSSSSSDDDMVEVEPNEEGKNEELGQDEGDDLFADVFNNEENIAKLDQIFSARTDETEQQTESKIESKQNPDIQEKAQTVSEIASVMKEQNHLYLKIYSKYVEETKDDVEKEAKEVAEHETGEKLKTKDKTNLSKSSASFSELEKQLEQEMNQLVAEMQSSSREAKLLKAKKLNESKVAKQPITINKVINEEERMLDELGVQMKDSQEYAKELVQNSQEERDLDDQANITYGASATSFVRSKKDSVVEVCDSRPQGENQDEEDVLIDRIEWKLSSSEKDTELSKAELMKIQDELASEQEQLVAERSRQERLAASVSDQMYKDCQELLQMFGLPWIVAPAEAEAECAFLDMIGLSQGTITDDSDIWLFGGLTVYKNFFNQDKHCERFCSDAIAKQFGLSREKLILIALLSGSDYTEGIETVGPVTAMEILAEFPGQGLEPLINFYLWWKGEMKSAMSKNKEKFKKLVLPPNFPSERVAKAYLDPEVDNSTEAFSWAVPNFVEVSDYAVEKFGWSRQKVDEIIKPVIRKMKEKTNQSRILDFFKKDRSMNMNALSTSSRVQNAVHKVLGKEPPLSSTDKSKGKSGARGNAKAKKSSAPKSEKVTSTDEAAEASTSSKSTSMLTSSSAQEVPNVPFIPPNSKHFDEKKKEDIKREAIELYKRKKTMDSDDRKSKKRKIKGKSIVLNEHNLSEDENGD